MPPPSGGVPELPSAMRAYFPRHKRLILPIKVVLACSASPRCPGSGPSHLPAAQPLACRPATLDRRKRKSRHERGPIVCSGIREQRWTHTESPTGTGAWRHPGDRPSSAWLDLLCRRRQLVRHPRGEPARRRIRPGRTTRPRPARLSPRRTGVSEDRLPGSQAGDFSGTGAPQSVAPMVRQHDGCRSSRSEPRQSAWHLLDGCGTALSSGDLRAA